MSEQEVRGLCLKSREIFLQQPILLELEAPLKICGTGAFPYPRIDSQWRARRTRRGLGKILRNDPRKGDPMPGNIACYPCTD